MELNQDPSNLNCPLSLICMTKCFMRAEPVLTLRTRTAVRLLESIVLRTRNSPFSWSRSAVSCRVMSSWNQGWFSRGSCRMRQYCRVSTGP